MCALVTGVQAWALPIYSARQAIDRSGTAEQGSADVEVSYLGVVGGDAEVAGDENLEPAGNRITLDAGDGRLLHFVDLVIGARRVDRELKRGAGFVQHRTHKLHEVRAGAEGVAATAEHDGQQNGRATGRERVCQYG